MLTRILLLLGLTVIDADAAWQRHVMTPKDTSFDSPAPHPLAYFVEFPMLRDESGDFCYLCSPEKRLAEAKKEKIATEINLSAPWRDLSLRPFLSLQVRRLRRLEVNPSQDRKRPVPRNLSRSADASGRPCSGIHSSKCRPG